MSTHESAHSSHVLPLGIYIGVASMLLLLTFVTVWVASIDFGAYNLVIAMFIAAVKATMVALIFMHLKYENKIYMIIFVISIIFLAIFITFTLLDTLQRDGIYDQRAGQIHESAAMYDSMNVGDVSHEAVPLGDSAQIVDSTATPDESQH